MQGTCQVINRNVDGLQAKAPASPSPEDEYGTLSCEVILTLG